MNNIKPVKKPVVMGIVGYGHYMRTNFVLRLRNCTSIKFAGVYNRGEERRKQAEEDGFWTTGDLDELLALPGLEAVLIGTANAAHKEQAIRAARAGKHILCEKPMALSVEDCDAMTAEAEKAGVVTHVNHPSPYTDGFMKFREIVQAEAGEILHVWHRSTRAFGLWSQGARHVQVAHPENSGGWTFHHFCHQLNDACLILGSSHATRVYHLMQNSAGAPSEELVNSLLTFESGATAFLCDGLSIGPFTDMGVQGTRADVRMIEHRIYLAKPGPPDPLQRPGNLTGMVQLFDAAQHGADPHETIGHVFAHAVRGDKNELLPFRFIRDQYRILTALKESAAKGKTVDLKWA